MLWFHLCISPITDCPTIHITSSQVVRDECLKRWIYVEKGGAAGYQDSHLGSGYPSGNSGFFCSKTKTEVHIIQYCYHYKKIYTVYTYCCIAQYRLREGVYIIQKYVLQYAHPCTLNVYRGSYILAKQILLPYPSLLAVCQSLPLCSHSCHEFVLSAFEVSTGQ